MKYKVILLCILKTLAFANHDHDHEHEKHDRDLYEKNIMRIQQQEQREELHRENPCCGQVFYDDPKREQSQLPIHYPSQRR